MAKKNPKQKEKSIIGERQFGVIDELKEKVGRGGFVVSEKKFWLWKRDWPK